ncbi:MAG: hypothetical protein EOQ39_30460 [Mesorhizobium sp.]|nr:MAG: hypothetical protein EOQ37_34775 [Mesorhizobium sp.]RWB10804.1 MAG: hypothetical protein EOQ39_30460 [Mesorhizobium sp.]
MVTRGPGQRHLCNRIGQPAGFYRSISRFVAVKLGFTRAIVPKSAIWATHYLLAARTSFGFTATRSWRP